MRSPEPHNILSNQSIKKSNLDLCPINSEGHLVSGSSCSTCLIKKLSLFKDLNEKDLSVLNEQRSVIQYKSGEPIYKQGARPAGLLCLSKGKVKIIKDNINGSEQIMSLKKPGEFLGFSDLLNEDVHTSSAIVLEDTVVCCIPEHDFLNVVKNNLSLASKIIKYLAFELVNANQRMANITQKHMRARLADALLYVNETYGVSPGSQSLSVNLKRSDLGALSNMSTANAIRTLSEFVKSELVEVDGRQIEILNLPELRKISLIG